ncbi:MAG: carboxypeptidase-like regulatory domain-containing protein [Bacteroidia bacterium]
MPQCNFSLIKYIYALALSALMTQSGVAQCTIKGNISDSTGKPFPFVAIGLMNAKDSSLVKGSVTNDSGYYSFSKIRPGIYIIKAQFIGYAEEYSSLLRADSGKTVRIPTLQLKNKGTNLKGVNVVADKPFMEH